MTGTTPRTAAAVIAIAGFLLFAAGPRAARAEAEGAATEGEVPVAGSALPEEAAEPGVADLASDATATGNWWTDQPWRFNANVYFWIPNAPAEFEVGTYEAEFPLRMGDIIKSLDMMAMLEFEVHKGPIGVFASPIYYDGTFRKSSQGPLRKRDLELDETLLELDWGFSYALGPWHLGKSDRSPAVTVEPFVGGRFLKDDVKLDIDPGITELQLGDDRVLIDPDILELQARSPRGRDLLDRGIIVRPTLCLRRPARCGRRLHVGRELIQLREDVQEALRDDLGNLVRARFDPDQTRTVTTLVDTTIDFVTPIVGLRTRWDLTRRWSLDLRGDIGGFHVDDVRSTYQLYGGVAYHFKMWNVSSKAFAAYRYIWIHYDDDEIAIRVRIRGPLVGIGFEF
jgi:hypothetical protein